MEEPCTRQPGDIVAWVAKAEQDYRSALILVSQQSEPVPDNVCFCAHQCVEKYLKSYLVWHRTRFPRTHDLLALLDLAVDVDGDLESLRAGLVTLNPYGVEVRYPGTTSSVEEARQSVQLMEEARALLRRKVRLCP